MRALQLLGISHISTEQIAPLFPQDTSLATAKTEQRATAFGAAASSEFAASSGAQVSSVSSKSAGVQQNQPKLAGGASKL